MEDFDDYKIIFYIVIAVLYFLFSGKKKPADKPKPLQKNEPPVKEVVSRPGPITHGKLLSKEVPKPEVQEAVPEKTYSLEEVLREFGSSLEEKRQPENVLEEIPNDPIVDYDENIEDEVAIAKREKARGVEVKEGEDAHFVPYSLDEKTVNPYAAFLSNPDGFKTAFVAQEILNRKHF